MTTKISKGPYNQSMIYTSDECSVCKMCIYYAINDVFVGLAFCTVSRKCLNACVCFGLGRIICICKVNNFSLISHKIVDNADL